MTALSTDKLEARDLRNLDDILRDPLSGLTWDNRIMAANAICELLNLRVPRFDGDEAAKAERDCHCDKLHPSDLCASGQQVRALTDALERIAGRKGEYSMPFPEAQEFYGTFAVMLARETLAALTPAPQPEGQVRAFIIKPEECHECGCRSFAEIDGHQGWRCVECKKVYASVPAPDAAQTKRLEDRTVLSIAEGSTTLLDTEIMQMMAQEIADHRRAAQTEAVGKVKSIKPLKLTAQVEFFPRLNGVEPFNVGDLLYAHPAAPAPGIAEALHAFEEIRELNMSGRDENGHRWANSDLIDQTVTAGLIALRAVANGGSDD